MELRSDLSKKYISEALIYLMKKKDYSSITNKDITDKAGLSHVTIYRNFNSKEEIIKYYLDTITEEFIKETKITYSPDNFRKYIITLFTHLEKNKEIALLLYKANMLHYLKDEFDKIFLAKAHNINEEYHYSFVSGGLYNIYYYWIKNNCKETPEEISNIFTDFYILKGNSN